MLGDAALAAGAPGLELAYKRAPGELDLAYAYSDVAFDWQRSDEMDRVQDQGSAELLEDGSPQRSNPSTIGVANTIPNISTTLLQQALRACPGSG